MSVDPELAAVLAALSGGVLVGLPRLHRAARRRRRAARECLVCARVVVLGRRTCDCPDDAA
jgi:hypothetical protein